MASCNIMYSDNRRTEPMLFFDTALLPHWKRFIVKFVNFTFYSMNKLMVCSLQRKTKIFHIKSNQKLMIHESA